MSQKMFTHPNGLVDNALLRHEVAEHLHGVSGVVLGLAGVAIFGQFLSPGLIGTSVLRNEPALGGLDLIPRHQADAFSGQRVAVGGVAVAVAWRADRPEWPLLASVVAQGTVFA